MYLQYIIILYDLIKFNVTDGALLLVYCVFNKTTTTAYSLCEIHVNLIKKILIVEVLNVGSKLYYAIVSNCVTFFISYKYLLLNFTIITLITRVYYHLIIVNCLCNE